MNWLVILQLVWEILKLIFSLNKTRRPGLLARLRAAKKKAEETGDTSDLEKLMAELAAETGK